MPTDIKKLMKDFDYLLKKEVENKFFIRKSSSEKNKENLYLTKSLKDIVLGKTMITIFESEALKQKLEIKEDFEYWEWVATIYYYSMLKIAKAIIAKKGYQTDDHYATLCALAKLFVVKNELDEEVLELFKTATELFEQKYVLYFHEGMESASESRYNISKDFEREKALEIRDKAIEFRKECLRILQVKG
jgi:uncharacterized protein (UPF0332 family)